MYTVSQGIPVIVCGHARTDSAVERNGSCRPK